MLNTKSMARAVSSFTAREIASLHKQAHPVFTNPYLSIKIGLSSDSHGKILIITPRKMGSAPDRNLVKRRLKALFYEEKLFTRSLDVMIYCKKGAQDIPYSELKKIIFKAFDNYQKKSSSYKDSNDLRN